MKFDFDFTISLVNFMDIDNSLVVVRYDHLQKNITPLPDSSLISYLHTATKVEASESVEEGENAEEVDQDEGILGEKRSADCALSDKFEEVVENCGED